METVMIVLIFYALSQSVVPQMIIKANKKEEPPPIEDYAEFVKPPEWENNENNYICAKIFTIKEQ